MIQPIIRKSAVAIFFAALFFVMLTSCGTKIETADLPESDIPPVQITPTQTITLPTASPAPQSLSAPAFFGPEIENFPADYNPLNAQQVKDPGQLKTPALLVSISHFPVTARPQAGLSFAPWVFEFYITEGATRFLSVFYGEVPEPEIPITGGCEIRQQIFTKTSNILGNWVWLDENKNGRQEDYEKGVIGVCVNLYNSSGQLIQQTTTDSNGYYGFNVNAGRYTVEIDLPAWLEFTGQNVGDENADSDADPVTGRMEANVTASLLYLDAGLIPSESINPPVNDSTQMPIAEVGPIRSGRMFYADAGNLFRSSCLIYAFASPEVLELIPQCVFVPHDEASGGAMMSLERMLKIAADNKRLTPSNFNYSGNLFREEAPAGGIPMDQLIMHVALLNQSGWVYDPLSESWLRFVDNAEVETAGQLRPAIDRLTGRQLQFENIIVIMVEHDVISPTNMDIHLELGDGGYAFLFRDGKKYDVRWSLKAREYEKRTGQARPLYFVDANGNQVPLKPGNTWIFVATPYSRITDEGNRTWQMKYYPPEGAK
ncbi:MAG: DUF3048 C-terminal domain-containing protein [Anaerolineales bacterium]|nr:DUF3048 C-terminal domain-containing protein [Anaerolineales bacterium]